MMQFQFLNNKLVHYHEPEQDVMLKENRIIISPIKFK